MDLEHSDEPWYHRSKTRERGKASGGKIRWRANSITRDIFNNTSMFGRSCKGFCRSGHNEESYDDGFMPLDRSKRLPSLLRQKLTTLFDGMCYLFQHSKWLKPSGPLMYEGNWHIHTNRASLGDGHRSQTGCFHRPRNLARSPSTR